jgi:uncharacterized protein
VEIEGLDPRLDGVRIVHLSDVHVGRLTPPEHVARAVELANETEPHLVAMTGDYVCWSRREIPLAGVQLGGLRARHRVMVTLGNHDYFTSGRRVAEVMKRNGYKVLRNQHTTVEVGGAPLHVVGVDDPVTRKHDIPRAFAEVPGDGPRIVLCHCPEKADEIAAHGADLILSGHTHGGQIYIKGITDRVITGMGRRYRRGFYEVSRSRLYVTSGVGFSGIRVRAGDGCASEVALFTLRAA